MKLPKYCVVDTNVPVVANRQHPFDGTELENEIWISACIQAIEHVYTKNALVIDEGDEIFSEYIAHLSLSGQPGVGDKFVKWVKDHRWQLPSSNRVKISKTDDGNSYQEFPDHPGLKNFDPSDRKFVAVANAHPKKISILQGTDCKWIGWSETLKDIGVPVIFLCPEYVQKKFEQKIKT